jgi:Spy/CpxP family protein refolding chaperone
MSVFLLCIVGVVLGAGVAAAAEKVTSVEAVQVDLEDGLGLTQEQKDKVRAVRDEYRSRRELLRNELNARYEALRKELDADTVVREKVDPMVAEIKTIQGQLIDNRVDVVLKLRAVYTPEQLRLIKERPQGAEKKSAVKKGAKKVRKLETKKQ